MIIWITYFILLHVTVMYQNMLKLMPTFPLIYINMCTIYIYCPVWRETWWFVQPRKFMSPKGEARGRHEFSWLNKSSWLPTDLAIKCLLYRKLKETYYQWNMHCIEVLHTLQTWRAKHVLWRHSPSHRSAVPRDTTGRQGDRETRRLEGDTTICLPSTWLYTNHISLFIISIIWRIIIFEFQAKWWTRRRQKHQHHHRRLIWCSPRYYSDYWDCHLISTEISEVHKCTT